MKEIKELARQMSRLSKDKGAIVNINIPVCGQAYFDCIKLNQMMQERTDINFEGLCRPHVTLKMGKVRNLDDLHKILTILHDCLQDCEAGIIHPQKVILKKPDENYYFCEIEDEKLMALSEMLNEKIGSLMAQPRHPISAGNAHHITLGFRFDTTPVCRNVIGKTVSDFRYDRICVALVVKHGVTLGSLRAFMLNLKKD